MKSYKLVWNPKQVNGFLKCSKDHTLQLEYQEDIVGALVGAFVENTFHILCIEILAKYRHQGHGRKFIELLERSLVDLGIEFLEADEVNPDDSPFWDKLGFVAVETEDEETLVFRRPTIAPERAGE